MALVASGVALELAARMLASPAGRRGMLHQCICSRADDENWLSLASYKLSIFASVPCKTASDPLRTL